MSDAVFGGVVNDPYIGEVATVCVFSPALGPLHTDLTAVTVCFLDSGMYVWRNYPRYDPT